MGVDRPLTEGERALARTVFGPAIDYPQVRLRHRRWVPLQPARYVMAPDGHIWFPPGNRWWREDFAEAGLDAQGLFIHEMTHVWQHQQGLCLPLARHPFCRYGYELRPDRPFARYGVEQQAEIARHAFLLMQSPSPGPALATFQALLPFSPDARAG